MGKHKEIVMDKMDQMIAAQCRRDAADDMYDALWETIELSDRTLPPSGRTPECQRVYDIVRAALRKAENGA